MVNEPSVFEPLKFYCIYRESYSTSPGFGAGSSTGIGVSLGPVVQSIVSLTSLLRGQLVKCFTTLLPNTMTFLLEKMGEAFALQKFLPFFQQKILANLRY